MKHNYYCEYIYCESRDSKLVPFKKDNDWSLRMLHKKCFKCIKNSGYPDIELINENPLNPVYDKCKCNKLNGEPCSMKADTEDFNKKFGYCKYHNYKKFHLIYD
tara:strand:- start:138 stop:449 length:312 start_codon:yes stop_codon:yes gene_type:complete